MAEPPFHSAPGDGQWARQVTQNWFDFWDLAKPVIAQVHGYAIAGATELAQACDLVYVADDARIGYPIVRVASPPDWQYHMPLLGRPPGDGDHAHRRGHHRRRGRGRSAGPTGPFPADELELEVLDVAERIAAVATDLAQINKRMVHRQAEIMGVRAAIRAGSEFQALAGHQASVEAFKADPLGDDEEAQRGRRRPTGGQGGSCRAPPADRDPPRDRRRRPRPRRPTTTGDPRATTAGRRRCRTARSPSSSWGSCSAPPSRASTPPSSPPRRRRSSPTWATSRSSRG